MEKNDFLQYSENKEIVLEDVSKHIHISISNYANLNKKN